MLNHDKQQDAPSEDESKKNKVSFEEVFSGICAMTVSLFGFLFICLNESHQNAAIRQDSIQNYSQYHQHDNTPKKTQKDHRPAQSSDGLQA